MKIRTIIAAIVLCVSAVSAQHKFYVDLTNRADDLFRVTLYPQKLDDKENKIFQFAASAPGTYHIMDIGRFVRSFIVFDSEGNEIKSSRVSINQWEISKPSEAAKIEYSIAETWDNPVDSNRILLMCGTSIEEDHVLINGQCVFGYFHGMQETPILVKINQPADWIIGTALILNEDGFYAANNFDHIVDSPILTGRLTEAGIKVGKCDIKVYTYSLSGKIKSSDILSSIDDIIKAEEKFIKGLPVDRYTFLFHFESVTMGAWEHSYSSEFIYKDGDFNDELKDALRSTIAHEFFHIITPLNIHSEVVEKFNFINPVMSRHLWLYEGVTEWASGIILLRDNLISLEEYALLIQRKLRLNDYFKQDISLESLALNSFTIGEQYFNIYMKGAVIAALLDIKLLKLSDGKRGLRELLIELSKKYGPGKSFSEKSFFDEFIRMTYPEIKDFIDMYIKGTETLPIKEYLAYVGLGYDQKDKHRVYVLDDLSDQQKKLQKAWIVNL